MSTDILNLLPPQRRRELENEVMTSLIRSVLLENKNSTFGNLVLGLMKSKHWKAIEQIKVSSVITPANGRSKRGRPSQNLSPEITDRLLATIKKNPGLRSEQLQKEVNFPQPMVKAALAELRRDKRVRTSGAKRSTTYKAA